MDSTRKTRFCRSTILALAVVVTCGSLSIGAEPPTNSLVDNPFDAPILDVRPRVFLRSGDA